MKNSLQHAFDDVSSAHEQYTRRHPLKSIFYAKLVRRFLRLVEPGRGDNIVELACGNGYYGGLCMSKGARLTFFDINASMLHATGQRLGGDTSVKWVQGDIRRLPFADASFDKTLCFGALPPLPTLDDMRLAIQEFVRITRPGGRVFFTYNPPCIMRYISVRYARFLAHFFKPSLRVLPFIDGRTSGMQRHEDIRDIVMNVEARKIVFETSGAGVFGLVCIYI